MGSTQKLYERSMSSLADRSLNIMLVEPNWNQILGSSGAGDKVPGLGCRLYIDRLGERHIGLLPCQTLKYLRLLMKQAGWTSSRCGNHEHVWKKETSSNDRWLKFTLHWEISSLLELESREYRWLVLPRTSYPDNSFWSHSTSTGLLSTFSRPHRITLSQLMNLSRELFPESQ